MRILICGGREYANKERFERAMKPFRFLQVANKKFLVAHGACGWPAMKGADALADQWALSVGLVVGKSLFRFPADWKKHGNSAGPIRNQEMFGMSKPDYVIAFPGGSGTRNMVEITRAAIHGGSECILMEVS